MKQYTLLAATALLLSATPTAFAQGNASAVSAKVSTRVPVREVARRLSKSSGSLVVTDRTVANTMVVLESSSAPLDVALQRLVAALPQGTQVRRVLIPALKAGATPPEGDQISALVDAQDALLAPVSGATTVGQDETNVLGKVLKGDQAKPAIEALNLKVVYLITNSKLKDDPVVQANQLQNEMLRRFLAMTPEQQSSMFDQQWDSMMNMDPAMRRALFQQQLQASMGMMQKLQKMPADQRQRFMDDIKQALPPGFGGGQPNP